MSNYISCSIIGYSSQSLYDYEKKLAIPTNAQPGVPNRIVSKSKGLVQPPQSNQAVYSFTRTELNDILNSPDIKAFDLLGNATDDDLRENFLLYTGSGVLYAEPTASTPTGYPTGSFNITESMDITRGADFKYYAALETRQFGPLVNRHYSEAFRDANSAQFPGQSPLPYAFSYNTIPDSNLMYSGSIGGGYPNSVKTFWSASGAELGVFPTQSFWDYNQQGEGVDIINFEPATVLHANYFDENGKSRIQLINWYEETGQHDKKHLQPKQLYFSPQTYYSTYQFPHGDMTLSLAGGTLTSFAPKAKLYIMTTSPQQLAPKTGPSYNEVGNSATSFYWLEALDLVKRFHLSKSIDPNTGYKRPTIVNMSKAFATVVNATYWTHPTIAENANLRNSGSASFEIGDLHENDGILFEYKNKYFLIASASGDNAVGRNGEEYRPNYKNRIGNSLYVTTYTGSQENIVHAINNFPVFSNSDSGHPFFISCSLQGNTLSITSSFPNRTTNETEVPYNSSQMAPYYVYTGSYNPTPNPDINPPDPIKPDSNPSYYGPFSAPFFVRPGTNIEETGSFVYSSSFDPIIANHITSIVVDGVEQVTGGNDNYLSADHFAITAEPVGLMGERDITRYKGGTLETNGRDGINLTWPLYEIQVNSTLDAMYEVADAGVIFCVSAGNRGNLISNSGSSNDKFFDSRNYDSRLADNYFIKDVDSGKADNPYALSGSRQYYNRSIFSNGTALHIGTWTLETPTLYGWGVIGRTPLDRRYLNSSTNRGPAVDAYMPSKGLPFGYGSPNKTGENSYFESSSISHIIFDSQSVIDTISESFSFLTGSSSGTGNPWFDDEMNYKFSFGSSGTSASSPLFAGMAALIVEKYPGMDIRDVRNYIHTYMPKIVTDASASYTYPSWIGIFDYTSTGRLYEADHWVSGSRQMGHDGILAHYPMNRMVGEISGDNLRIEGVEFKM